MPFVDGGGHFKAKIIQPVLTDHQAGGNAQRVIAAHKGEHIIVALVGLALAIHIGMRFQIGLQIGAVLVDDIIQGKDVAVLNGFLGATGIALPGVFHNIRQITVRKDQVELLVELTRRRMQIGDGHAGALHQTLAKGRITHIGIVGRHVGVQFAPIGQLFAAHGIAEFLRRCIGGIGGSAAARSAAGSRRSAATAASQQPGGQRDGRQQSKNLVAFFHGLRSTP